MSGITNSVARRIGDGPLALSMQRFEGPAKQALWRIGASAFVSDSPTIAQDADIASLRQARAFFDEAIKLFETDGGRKTSGDDA